MIDTLLAYKGAALIAWILGILALERVLPAVPPRGGWPRLTRNLGLWLVNTALSPLIVVPVSAYAATVSIGPLGDWRPAAWQGAAAIAIDVLVLDMLIYWWHRANHVVPFLWRFHEVHHLDRFLDATSALRFHFGEVLLSAAFRAVVIIMLDMPLASVLVFETLVIAAAVFHHSNLAIPPRIEAALSRVVVTPAIHWVHHHRKRRDTDSNYATIFSIWDPIFRSKSATRRWADMPIGVEREEETDLARLFARPFRRRR